MKLYIFHLPDLGAMWAVMARTTKEAVNMARGSKVNAVLHKVLEKEGEGILFRVEGGASVFDLMNIPESDTDSGGQQR